jgi:hypothetical protein
MQSPDHVQAQVSMIELKGLARTMLPASSALRHLILAEPDFLPAEEAAVKAKVFSKLLYRESESN